MIVETERPMSGATKMKISVKGHLPTTRAPNTDPGPCTNACLAIAPPARPPIRAWVELVGSPTSQVNTSHTIAPTTAARSTYAVRMCSSTKPFPMELATLVPKVKAATKLKNAAQATACSGDTTRVEMIVATELAESRN